MILRSRLPALQVLPNVVPMVGIATTLSLVPLVGMATFCCPGFDVGIPRARTARLVPNDSLDIVVAIDRDGNYYLNKRPIRALELARSLRQMLASRPDEYLLYVRADKGVDYQAIQTVLDLAADSGVRVIGFIAWSPPRSPLEIAAQQLAARPASP